MKNPKTDWFCKECGYESRGWLGRCPGCQAWNSFVESPRVTGEEGKTKTRSGWVHSTSEAPTRLSDVETRQAERLTSSLAEFDRALGGGFVPGSLLLLGGEPGIGKSTLVLQVLAGIKSATLYVSGEESREQIRLRADRVAAHNDQLYLLADTNVLSILEQVQELKPAIVVIDSIQTLYHPERSGAPGSPGQLRDVAGELLRLAKSTGSVVLLIGHVTKDGQLAGPRLLEHMVDTVLAFEGDRSSEWRILRATKNRFGATDELGLFVMTEKGLEVLVDTSELARLSRAVHVTGSAVTAVVEGTRPLILEIQALLVPSAFPAPLRTTQGIDRLRLGMLLAILEKRTHLGLLSMDAYVNVTGGIRLSEPSSDLAIVAALLSSVKEQPLSHNAILLGEVGLGGELRRIQRPERRLNEALRFGFRTVVLPAENEKSMGDNMRREFDNLYFVNDLDEAMDVLFSP